MTRRLPSIFLGFTTAMALLAACARPGESIIADYERIPSANVPIELAPIPTAPQPAPASASAPASGSASAPPSASAFAAGSSSGAALSAGSSSGAPKPPPPPAKEYACGDKGKPDCPMQKWMKGVAGGAVASGDGARIARAFRAMSKAPPGMGAWAGICATGAAKAEAGDIDGAKAQCKACHVKYQSAYHRNLRDLAWP